MSTTIDLTDTILDVTADEVGVTDEDSWGYVEPGHKPIPEFTKSSAITHDLEEISKSFIDKS